MIEFDGHEWQTVAIQRCEHPGLVTRMVADSECRATKH